MQRDDGAADPAIANQKITAEADPMQRHSGRNRREERRDIATIARFEIKVRGATDVPRSMACHRFVELQTRREVGGKARARIPV
jgi:hypothetical protein